MPRDIPCAEPSSTSTVTRRRLFGGAATAGALAAAAAVLPRTDAPVEATAAPAADATTDTGYRLTEHIRRYYQTART